MQMLLFQMLILCQSLISIRDEEEKATEEGIYITYVITVIELYF